MNIRDETADDHAAIQRVHTESFPTDAEARLVDNLRAAGNLSISLVAEDDGQILGHVACSPVTGPALTTGLGLAPVAVLPSARRRGIADQLIRAALAVSAEQGHGYVVVLGDPAYYSRFDFHPGRTWNLLDEYGGGDGFQAIELQPAAITPSGGLVQYSAEFAGL
ncbi:MAG: putative acetyltransferase [Chlamydiales bacterium]|jgi:putative acetyltransferase